MGELPIPAGFKAGQIIGDLTIHDGLPVGDALLTKLHFLQDLLIPQAAFGIQLLQIVCLGVVKMLIFGRGFRQSILIDLFQFRKALLRNGTAKASQGPIDRLLLLVHGNQDTIQNKTQGQQGP